jgi:hypothetical protein
MLCLLQFSRKILLNFQDNINQLTLDKLSLTEQPKSACFSFIQYSSVCTVPRIFFKFENMCCFVYL